MNNVYGYIMNDVYVYIMMTSISEHSAFPRGLLGALKIHILGPYLWLPNEKSPKANFFCFYLLIPFGETIYSFRYRNIRVWLLALSIPARDIMEIHGNTWGVTFLKPEELNFIAHLVSKICDQGSWTCAIRSKEWMHNNNSSPGTLETNFLPASISELNHYSLCWSAGKLCS